MDMVIMNLIINACDALENNGRILINLKNTDSEIILKIKDNGCGIKDEDLPNIFQPFFSTKDKGLGLGLAHCQEIIEKHSGIISVTSKPGTETEFTIILPKKLNG